MAKIDLISSSANSLNLKYCQSAPHLHRLLKSYDPAPRITTNCEKAKFSLNILAHLTLAYTRMKFIYQRHRKTY